MADPEFSDIDTMMAKAKAAGVRPAWVIYAPGSFKAAFERLGCTDESEEERAESGKEGREEEGRKGL